MPEPPSSQGGGRSERWAETNRPGLGWSRTRSHGSRLGRCVPARLSSVVRYRHIVSEMPLRLRDAVIRAGRMFPELQTGLKPSAVGQSRSALTPWALRCPDVTLHSGRSPEIDEEDGPSIARP